MDNPEKRFPFKLFYRITRWLIAVGLLHFVIVSQSTSTFISSYAPTPAPQEINWGEVKKAIFQYRDDNGHYPKRLTDLTHSKHAYFSEVPIDPLTGAADWDVAEAYKDQLRWYRTSNETYPGAPPQWNPGSESSICDIRPRKISE